MVETKDENKKSEEKKSFKQTFVKKKTLSVEVPSLANQKLNERRQGRILALQAMYSWDYQTDLDLNELCLFKWDRKKNQVMKDFAARLVRGTIENIDAIDDIIRPKLVGWDFERISRVNRSILRISIFSLIHMEDVPVKVTIDEAVDLSKMFSEKDDFKFINAVLDKVKDEFRRESDAEK